jgi:uncharacterized membrane protein (DUF4010 family)
MANPAGGWRILDIPFLNLAVALGVGLLVGAERERRARARPSASAAGIRTFAMAALAGAVSLLVGGVTLLAITTAAAGLLAALGYWRTRDEEDPGITTEIALVFTVLVGALAVREPGLAAGVGVVAAILLAARTPLHHFVGAVLTEHEGRDALILAGATLVVLPLLPDRAMGPYGALNPHAIWIIVVLVLAIGAAGHVAVRALGARFGLPIAGLASGFISSTATIGAMGARAAKDPTILSAAVAGAVLSTVATIVQMSGVVAATSLPTLQALSGPLICAGLAAAAYGAIFTIRALRQAGPDAAARGEAFSLSTALLFALTLSVILVASAALRAQFGTAGAIAAAALAGLVDTHAAAVSIASLVASGRMSPADAVAPILVGLSSNTITKLIFAATSGGRGFAVRVIPGLVLVAAAAWVGELIATGMR